MTDTTTDADPAFKCTLTENDTVADATIKEAMATADMVSYDAWAWNAAVAMGNMAAAAEEEGDGDSASMISTAFATIAAIAMVAY